MRVPKRELLMSAIEIALKTLFVSTTATFSTNERMIRHIYETASDVSRKVNEDGSRRVKEMVEGDRYFIVISDSTSEQCGFCTPHVGPTRYCLHC